MKWRRSMVKEVDYKFPSGAATIIFEHGEGAIVDAGHGLRNILEVMCGGEHEMPANEDLVGKEMIFWTNETNEMQEFCTLEEWEGPEIKLGDEIEYEPKDTVDLVLDRIHELNEKALYPTDMKEAVIGVVERFGLEPLVLLDRTKCISILMGQDMTEEEAEEYFQFNTIGSWMGEGTPCFATLNDDLV